MANQNQGQDQGSDNKSKQGAQGFAAMDEKQRDLAGKGGEAGVEARPGDDSEGGKAGVNGRDQDIDKNKASNRDGKDSGSRSNAGGSASKGGNR